MGGSVQIRARLANETILAVRVSVVQGSLVALFPLGLFSASAAKHSKKEEASERKSHTPFLPTNLREMKAKHHQKSPASASSAESRKAFAESKQGSSHAKGWVSIVRGSSEQFAEKTGIPSIVLVALVLVVVVRMVRSTLRLVWQVALVASGLGLLRLAGFF